VNPSNFHLKIKKFENIDICFNALHGSYGEDGTIQEILLNNNLKFTHSDVQASKNAFNKNLTKLAISKTKVNYLKSLEITKKEIVRDYFINLFKDIGAFVLKPTSSGSSFGVIIFIKIDDIDLFFNNIQQQIKTYKYHNNFIIEPYINGRELTVAVNEEKGMSKSIEVTEIISKNIFFDYEAKYSKGFSQHILPALIPNKIYYECLSNAKIVHDILGCRGLSRSDFLYDEEKDQLYFLEINTQPGLTPLSLVPEQLNYNKINFTSLIDNLINTSL